MSADLEFVARNIVNQVLDESGADVTTRQAINDDCDAFVLKLLRRVRATAIADTSRNMQSSLTGAMAEIKVAVWDQGYDHGYSDGYSDLGDRRGDDNPYRVEP